MIGFLEQVIQDVFSRGQRQQLRSVGRKMKLQLSFVVGKQKLLQSSFERKKLNEGLWLRSVLST